MEQTTNPVQSSEGKNKIRENEDQMERKTRRGKMRVEKEVR